MGPGEERKPAASEVLTIEELALYLKIAKSTLYKLSQEGRIPAQKVGRHWRYRKDAIDRWLEEGEHPSGAREGASSK
jgi:excisionase family DNA binding protein